MKIQLKHSSANDPQNPSLALEPTASQMEFGEVAVNYNVDDPTLFLKASDNSIVGIKDQSPQISALDSRLTTAETNITSNDTDIASNGTAISTNATNIAANSNSITTINNTTIPAIETDVQAIENLIPNPLTATNHVANTLDVRYVSRYSWSDISVLP